MPFFDKHYHAPGTSPGSLHDHPMHTASISGIRLVYYDDAGTEVLDPAEITPDMRDVADGRRVSGCTSRVAPTVPNWPPSVSSSGSIRSRSKMCTTPANAPSWRTTTTTFSSS